ncbi:phenoloxidase 1-like [Penaeus japonicus]|uniref:phenoloxidase 1-like n=1 Tax=Penaeus japonicus TaxID=27405 RepID=UPI001C7164AD|nr:phenoloxidase 1-like [Penaeus japonicus]
MDKSQKNLLYLFELPQDPISLPRGGGKIHFDLENDASRPPVVSTRLAGNVPVDTMPVPERGDVAPENLGTATSVPIGSPFSFFIKSHRQAAKDLCGVFMKTKNAEDLLQVATRVHGQVNETLYIYALSFVILRKKELRNSRLPSIIEVFPGKFIPHELLMRAQLKINHEDPNQTEPLIVDHEFSGTHLKPEHRLAYWREDYGINAHHWHWHLVYPIDMDVNRDRKGELFYYMHQQMIARYDMERLSLGLPRVQKLENWRAPISDGYFSKLTVNNSGRAWGSRQDDTIMQDFQRNDFGLDFTDVTDLEIWRSRLLDAIHQGSMVDRQGKRVTLSDDVTSGKRGIDILGDAFEADSTLSVNFPYYGDLHNMGHVLIAFSHDPDFAHKEDMAVMGDTATAMRDPVFYRWHKFVDDTFQEYKVMQRPYTEEELNFSGVKIEKVGVVRNDEADILHTGWNKRGFEASRGLDFNGRPVLVELKHLDHEPFNYHLQLNNRGRTAKEVTVRVFLAPKFNARGQKMNFMEQRILWAEMDKFTVSLKPGGNHVVRSSKDSSITNPEELTFRDLENSGTDPASPDATAFNFCGCGWPQHMLVPRGRPEGMAFQLFFMLTDYAIDKVTQPATRSCPNGVSFCGIQDAKYPDTRPMGFPFDRRPPPMILNRPVEDAADYARLDNAFIHDISIKFLADELKLN